MDALITDEKKPTTPTASELIISSKHSKWNETRNKQKKKKNNDENTLPILIWQFQNILQKQQINFQIKFDLWLNSF